MEEIEDRAPPVATTNKRAALLLLTPIAFLVCLQIVTICMVHAEFRKAAEMCLLNDGYIPNWDLFPANPYQLTIGQHLEQKDALLRDLYRYKEATALEPVQGCELCNVTLKKDN